MKEHRILAPRDEEAAEQSLYRAILGMRGGLWEGTATVRARWSLVTPAPWPPSVFSK